MSRWFQDRRQEFISATLRQFGQIRRADLVRQFDISIPQAANDIAEFMARAPIGVRYDVSAKSYVFEDPAPQCPSSPTGRHIIDTSMESGPNNCFHCEAHMESANV